MGDKAELSSIHPPQGPYRISSESFDDWHGPKYGSYTVYSIVDIHDIAVCTTRVMQFAEIITDALNHKCALPTKSTLPIEIQEALNSGDGT